VRFLPLDVAGADVVTVGVAGNRLGLVPMRWAGL
jgi:hypothetical protein